MMSEQNAAAATEGSIGLGLLKDVEDPSQATQYTQNLEYSKALLNQEGVFWQAVCKDAGNEDPEAYLQNLLQKLQNYMATDHVFGRQKLKAALKEKITDGNPNITILLGGYSTGKNQLLSAMAKEVMHEGSNDMMDVYVNSRKDAGGSLKDGIKRALVELDESNFFADANWHEIGASLPQSMSLQDRVLGLTNEDVASLAGALELCNRDKGVHTDANVLQLLITLAEKVGKKPCLIIDEANLLVKGGKENDPLVHYLMHLTKESHALKVMLCSSNHSYPERLVKGGLQMILVDLTYAFEPSPKEIFPFLTAEKMDGSETEIIGMGNELATLIVSLVGGSLAVVPNLLATLMREKNNFRGASVLHDFPGAHNIPEALENDEYNLKHNLAILGELARIGYAFVRNEQCASIVDGGIAVGLNSAVSFVGDDSDDAKETAMSSILLPSSCAVRNLIAYELERTTSSKYASRHTSVSGSARSGQ